MWSFGNKRDDPAQVAPDKHSSRSHYQPRQPSSGDRTRTSSAPRPDQYRKNSQQQSTGGSLSSKSKMFQKAKKLSMPYHNGSNPNKSAGKPLVQRQHKTPSPRRTLPNGMKPKKFMSKRWGGKKNDYLQDMSVNETSNGIEVTFPGYESGKGSEKNKSVISLKEQILQRQYVYKTQFPTDATSAAANMNNWRPKGHRIPLMGMNPADTAYTDALQLLRDSPVVDESTAVQEELVLMESEITSLQRDRMWLEQGIQNASLNGRKQDALDDGMNKENMFVAWNAHKLLKDDASQKQPLSDADRSALQIQRGNSLTIYLTNDSIQELFVHNQESARCTSLLRNDSSVTTIIPSNNGSQKSAATSLHHISLLHVQDRATSDAGLYFSHDDGSSEILGRLPDQLTRRFEVSGGSVAEEPEVGDLAYLTTGSRGCYFAKFHSGECWWGSAFEDNDFQNVMKSLDVHRVAFGSMKTIEINQGNHSDNSMETITTNSWIVLSHDGQAVWKNLPPRLSKLLENRLPNSAAPAEVSLGPGDSYFIRFLDGFTDYSLPAKVAHACDKIEEQGGTITYVCLHPEVSHSFVIRHTELTR